MKKESGSMRRIIEARIEGVDEATCKAVYDETYQRVFQEALERHQQIAFEAADVEADRAAQRALARRAAGGRQLPEIEELEDNRFPEF